MEQLYVQREIRFVCVFAVLSLYIFIYIILYFIVALLE